jgi:hypothetical protein
MEGGTYTERIIGLHRTQSVIAQAGRSDDFIDFFDVTDLPVNMDFITQSMRRR